ncbi:MAG: MFS transporter [Bacteroidetes bacterium 4572_77]|nr:MAG: MFS transporter [Bacteroidetes bacterium 4572_77]
MSFGFLGIQFGFALQNANASRILSTFGADVEHLSWFWLAAPLTGMIVQPIIGYFSDKTWNRFGRRRPYFFFGAVLTSIALVLMPNAGNMAIMISPMLIGAGMLMIMDASINISMEPFRALVADLLPSDQRTLGFSIQTFLIGVGAVFGSWMPYILGEWIGISKVANDGGVPDNVIFSFYIGAAVLLITILWTVFNTKEYPPEEFEEFSHQEALEKGEKFIEEKKHSSGLAEIIQDFKNMPLTMKQLGIVQFFSWFALFSMWVFSTPAIAQHIYGLDITDVSSEKYNEAGNWVGTLFAVYNGVAMFFALALPFIAAKIGRKKTHSVSLLAGGIGLISFYFIEDKNMLLFSMIGIGMAWASILAMPYAILAGSIPVKKMGIYMGIFNFFITFPQIVNGVFGGPVVKRLYDSQAIYAILIAGIFMILGALSVVFVQDKDALVE